jgi:hypothetical protein
MVVGPVGELLLLQPLLRPRHKRLPGIWVGQAVSTALPSPKSQQYKSVHLKALTKELATSIGEAVKTHKGRAVIRQLKTAIEDLLVPPVSGKQRVVTSPIKAPSIANDTQVPITKILEAPAIMQTWDPARGCTGEF